jgi:L-cysteine S-thiosulfotransferase
MKRRVRTAILAGAGTSLAACATPSDGLVRYEVAGDSIPAALTSTAGDPQRGRAIVVGREGNCLLCHAIPETGEKFMGNVAPPLSGVGSRRSAGQLRLRIVDSTRLNKDVAMPAYYRVHGLDSPAAEYRGKPILTAQQVEDVVAYLRTLR